MTQGLPVDQAELESALGRLLGTDAVQVDQWSCESLPYLQYRPGRSIQRLSGVATCAGRTISWSLIVKCFGDPGVGPRAAEATAGAERELCAYTSGLLTDLPPGIAVPRFLGTFQRSGGETSVWLEDVADRYGGHWAWYLPAGLIRTVAEDALRSTVIENTGLTLDELVRRRVTLTDFLLARADEARSIANRLGLVQVS
jgi:hypothetical protein